MRFLFWNMAINSKTIPKKNVFQIEDILITIISEQNCDTVVLAEYEGDIELLCNRISCTGKDFRQIDLIGCDRIKLISSVRFYVDLFEQSSKYSIVRLKNYNFDCILVMLHFVSAIYNHSDTEREIDTLSLINSIKTAEEKAFHSKTIVVGDFNANPFEDVLLRANLFCAVPFRQEAVRETRRYAKRDYRMFYNPMWKLFNDKSFPSGTYYFSGSNNPNNTFWHMLDQVLIRPSLIDRFEFDMLRIIHRTDNYSLLDKKGHPDKKISDHLPLFFEIREEI